MKFTAPADTSHLEFDNVEYHRDENGHFEIKHPDHIAHAFRHGLTPATVAASPVPQTAEERDNEIAVLQARLASLQAAPVAAPVASEPVPATDTPAHPADASGDTSETTGGATDQAAALDLDAASRDDMVAWLANNGVTISPASSKDAARKAVEDFLAGSSN